MAQQEIIQHPKAEKEKKKRKIVTMIIVILLLIFGGLFGWKLYTSNNEGQQLEEAVSAKLGQLENKSNEEIQAELNRVIDESSMAISINSNPVFVHGLAQGTLQIENSPANHYAQNIVITRDDNGQVIYESGLLMPNYHIQTDTLDIDLDKGEYDCTATFTAYQIEGEEKIEVGSSACKIQITVLS